MSDEAPELQSVVSRAAPTMSKQAVSTDSAPKPLPGIYNQVRANPRIGTEIFLRIEQRQLWPMGSSGAVAKYLWVQMGKSLMGTSKVTL